MNDKKWALIVSPTAPAQEAADKLKALLDWVPVEEADQAVVLGGDGFMLQTLHQMLNRRKIMPVYGMNLGTVGFLMNNWHLEDLNERLAKARAFKVKPLKMDVETISGASFTLPAINEVSLLRETRQTAKLEIEINGRIMMEELVCDGVLIATPAGSTAYNLSANGPILPLTCNLLALTPISPFRPRRWKGAILPDKMEITIRVLNPEKRPVSAVGDQQEVRDVSCVKVAIDRSQSLTMLFDPEHALDDRIAMEQFVV
ncbi:NAD kinase [Sphingorhabdus sp. YGSMI21]|uniref:NAD kinase n=1 Tax=Sphingorhabdus sp. YGSMI21 TaxID=2077182 RepID=UPI000C1EA815|nr:NAD kinase [Sphingorhabdus sp. YGSMI21]ATW04961.1 NAD kinase [Sphingorhabdus sp. YGSMI21]